MSPCCRRWMVASVVFGAVALISALVAVGESSKAAKAEEWASAVQWEAQEWAMRMEP